MTPPRGQGWYIFFILRFAIVFRGFRRYCGGRHFVRDPFLLSFYWGTLNGDIRLDHSCQGVTIRVRHFGTSPITARRVYIVQLGNFIDLYMRRRAKGFIELVTGLKVLILSMNGCLVRIIEIRHILVMLRLNHVYVMFNVSSRRLTTVARNSVALRCKRRDSGSVVRHPKGLKYAGVGDQMLFTRMFRSGLLVRSTRPLFVGGQYRFVFTLIDDGGRAFRGRLAGTSRRAMALVTALGTSNHPFC